MTPVHKRPNPCVTQARQASVCEISPPYVAPFRSSSRTDAEATFAYCIDYLLACCFVIFISISNSVKMAFNVTFASITQATRRHKLWGGNV